MYETIIITVNHIANHFSKYILNPLLLLKTFEYLTLVYNTLYNIIHITHVGPSDRFSTLKEYC